MNLSEARNHEGLVPSLHQSDSALRHGRRPRPCTYELSSWDSAQSLRNSGLCRGFGMGCGTPRVKDWPCGSFPI